jgi:hypothetical protein
MAMGAVSFNTDYSPSERLTHKAQKLRAALIGLGCEFGIGLENRLETLRARPAVIQISL